MSMAEREGLIWFDGELIPWKNATVHVLTHSLHYGVGVFEGVRAYATDRGTAIFRLQDHTQRLYHSAHIMEIKIPYDQKTLNEAQKTVVRENNLPDAYIRPLVFYGAEGMGLRAEGLTVHVVIAAWQWPTYLSEAALQRGIQVKTSSFTRHHVNSAFGKAKVTGHYTNSMMALSEALRNGAEEALMLDQQGYIAEGSGENIFMVQQGKLYTPTLNACLDGITRNTIIALSAELGLKVIEKQITRDELYIAEEAFFTGTAAEVMPICAVDGRTIGNGERGPITAKLQQLYFDLVMGKRSHHGEWLAFV